MAAFFRGTGPKGEKEPERHAELGLLRWSSERGVVRTMHGGKRAQSKPPKSKGLDI